VVWASIPRINRGVVLPSHARARGVGFQPAHQPWCGLPARASTVVWASSPRIPTVCSKFQTRTLPKKIKPPPKNNNRHNTWQGSSGCWNSSINPAGHTNQQWNITTDGCPATLFHGCGSASFSSAPQARAGMGAGNSLIEGNDRWAAHADALHNVQTPKVTNR